ncbi:MAG: ribosome maturation factor RimP [Candidatus Cloacimonetes bacterium]|nr:ribosome maturation factor RimP [Candidatus Cloacimonadota bacterium]
MMNRLEEIIRESCLECKVNLYDWELKNAAKGKLLIVFISKIGGVNITDCRIVSRKISNILDDEEDLIPDRFFLEVSSPGLERELKKKAHFTSAINENINVSFSENDKINNVMGILKEVSLESITVETNAEIYKIDFSSIKKAKTYFDFKGRKR